MINYLNILSEGGNPLSTILLPAILVLLVGGFFWSNYTAKKRQKSAQELISNLAIGDKVKTIGGVCGVIFEINSEENTFVLETGTDELKSYIKFDRQAIYQTESKQTLGYDEVLDAEAQGSEQAENADIDTQTESIEGAENSDGEAEADKAE